MGETTLKTLEYQVVEQKAKGFMGGRMKPEALAKLLNGHAAQGWELDRIIDNEGHASFGMAKDVFYVVFKRPLD